MASGSAAARLRRRSCRARAPNSCASETIAIRGSVSVRPPRSGATVSARRRVAVREGIPALHRARPRDPCPRSISCSTSRRPGESAAISTRPSNSPETHRAAASGCSARASIRSSRGAAVGKLRTSSAAAPQLGIRLEGLERDGGKAVELGFELRRLENSSAGAARPLDVVPAILVARRDVAPGLARARRAGRRRAR